MFSLEMKEEQSIHSLQNLKSTAMKVKRISSRSMIKIKKNSL